MKVSDLKGEVKVVYSPTGEASAQTTAQTPKTLLGSQTAANLATGLGKSYVGAAKGLGTIGQRFLDQTAGRVVNASLGKGFTPTTSDMGDIYRPNSVVGKKIDEVLKPQGTAEKIGAGVGELSLFLLPAFKVAKAERYVDLLSKGISSPLGAAAYRLTLKGAAQAAAAGGVEYLKTGGDSKKAIRTGATAGALRVGFGAIGEAARALKIPERLYQTIFKNAKSDMLDEFNSDGLMNLKNTNPQRYQELVDKGVIQVKEAVGGKEIAATIDRHAESGRQIIQNLPKQNLEANGGVPALLNRVKTNIVDALDAEGKGAASEAVAALNTSSFNTIDDFVAAAKAASTQTKPFINETLAEQALHRGLSGSIRKMANEAVGKKLETEYAVQQIVKNYTKPVTLREPANYERILRRIAAEYEDVGFGEVSGEAAKYADIVKQTGGKLSAQDALDIRRLLYKAIRASSFEKEISHLSLSQANLRTLAGDLRERLNAIPGMGQRMNDYAFYIDALEALAKEAARRGNAQVVSLIDSILLGGGIASGNPVVGFGAATLRSLTKAAPVLTGAAQAVQRGTLSPATTAAVGATGAAIDDLLQGSQTQTQ